LAHRLPVLVRGDSNGLAEPIGVKGAIKRRVLKIFFSRIAGFLAIGTHNANFYRSYGVPEERLFWTPYAVDNDFFGEQVTNFAEQRYLLRTKEGIPPEPPAILFCGKFVDKKRPLDLLRAFAALGTGVESSLIFVGDGPLRPAMEDFVASQRLERVFFLGFRNQTELPACYALADVLVLPSSFEPWGLVLNEAMASGLPVIASERVGAAADLIRQGVNGFVFPVGDVSALTHYLRTILKDRCAREEMGRQSRVIVSGWGLSESVNGVLKALDSIVR
jgi:glycosyltransferase involved in cell wall biosynthesis